MNKLYFAFLTLLFIPVISLTGQNYSGTLTGNITWGPGTVNIVDDVVLTGDLTIESGTTILFSDLKKITIDKSATIKANGTSDAPIIFTNNNSEVGWRGIYFEGDNNFEEPASLFRYCVFEHGLSNGGEGSSTDEQMGGAVSLFYHSGVEFFNCTFRNNGANLCGGALDVFESGVKLRDCVFEKNQTLLDYKEGGAIRLANNGDLPLEVVNCRFFNNSAYTGGAIRAESTSGLKIIGSLFANNQANAGAAITVSGTARDLWMVSNTMVNNHSLNASDPALVFPAVQNLNLTNNIIYLNTHGSSGSSQIKFVAEPTGLVMANCLIAGGLGGVEGLPSQYLADGILDEYPEFVAPTSQSGLGEDGGTGLWQLTESSPAINAGKADISGLGLPDVDLEGNSRVQQGRIDIGAYESSFVPTLAPLMPAQNAFAVAYLKGSGGIRVIPADDRFYSLSLYDITGVCVFDGRGESFSGEVVLSGYNLTSGVYILVITDSPGRRETHKVAVF